MIKGKKFSINVVRLKDNYEVYLNKKKCRFLTDNSRSVFTIGKYVIKIEMQSSFYNQNGHEWSKYQTIKTLDKKYFAKVYSYITNIKDSDNNKLSAIVQEKISGNKFIPRKHVIEIEDIIKRYNLYIDVWPGWNMKFDKVKKIPKIYDLGM